MKKKLLILALALSRAVWAGDYEDGKAAYDAENYTVAFPLVKKIAEQGYSYAQTSLGWMHRQGEGVKQDYAVAVRWYTKAAEQGDAYAQYNLGLMYQNGEGVKQDDAVAARWVTKAAEQ
jgi:TPR repeat protein